ncbi:hypothetical protein HPP92_002619 [Vanilla planifolia]|uniref:Uncharacterized protein n=1 Tax=Vanilla planifolia TaxID=51239 RepID=A0A835S5U3_VANPL|nr:hypothetical protein HPP92_002619 [Vanilla planifolia]
MTSLSATAMPLPFVYDLEGHNSTRRRLLHRRTSVEITRPRSGKSPTSSSIFYTIKDQTFASAWASPCGAKKESARFVILLLTWITHLLPRTLPPAPARRIVRYFLTDAEWGFVLAVGCVEGVFVARLERERGRAVDRGGCGDSPSGAAGLRNGVEEGCRGRCEEEEKAAAQAEGLCCG